MIHFCSVVDQTQILIFEHPIGFMSKPVADSDRVTGFLEPVQNFQIWMKLDKNLIFFARSFWFRTRSTATVGISQISERLCPLMIIYLDSPKLLSKALTAENIKWLFLALLTIFGTIDSGKKYTGSTSAPKWHAGSDFLVGCVIQVKSSGYMSNLINPQSRGSTGCCPESITTAFDESDVTATEAYYFLQNNMS